MRTRLFLLALAVVNMAAAAMAQAGGRGMPFLPGKKDPISRYDEGYRDGWNDAMNNARTHNEFTGGHTGRPAGSPISKDHPYGDGYRDGYSAGRRFTGGGIGGISVSIGGSAPVNPIAVLGQYLGPPQGAENYQQAYQEAIQNRKQRAQARLAKRQMHDGHRAQQEALHPHATPEELAAFNQARLPAPLAADEFDPARGTIQWPAVLNRPEFDDNRAKLEGLFRQAAANPHGSGLGTQNYRDIEHAVDEMHDQLHSEIAEFTPKAYIAASKFLKSLAYRAKGLSK